MKKEKVDSAFKDALGFLEKKYGKEVFSDLEGKENITHPAISTRSILVDAITGIQGLPIPGIVEIYGQFSSGKTTLALQTLAEAQSKGEVVAIVDVENVLDLKYAAALGLDLSDARKGGFLFFAQPNGGEEALQVVDALVRSGKVRVIVVDSVAALCAAPEMENDMDKVTVGLQARLMGQALRKLVALVNKNNVLLIFINQLRDKLGTMGYGERTTTPGGHALRYYSSMRLAMVQIQKIKDANKEVIATTILVTVSKNKCGVPYRSITTSIRFGEGFDKYSELIKVALENKVIEKAGHFYTWERNKFAGYEELRSYLKGNIESFEMLRDKLKGMKITGGTEIETKPITLNLNEKDKE